MPRPDLSSRFTPEPLDACRPPTIGEPLVEHTLFGHPHRRHIDLRTLHRQDLYDLPSAVTGPCRHDSSRLRGEDQAREFSVEVTASDLGEFRLPTARSHSKTEFTGEVADRVVRIIGMNVGHPCRELGCFRTAREDHPGDACAVERIGVLLEPHRGAIADNAPAKHRKFSFLAHRSLEHVRAQMISRHPGLGRVASEQASCPTERIERLLQLRVGQLDGFFFELNANRAGIDEAREEVRTIPQPFDVQNGVADREGFSVHRQEV